MEAVDIFPIVDGHDHLLLVDMLRQGQLHDESVYIGVIVQLFDLCQDLVFRDVLLHPDERRTEPAGLAREYLILYIGLTATVMTYQDGSKMRTLAPLGQHLLHLCRYLLLDEGSCCFTVYYLHIRLLKSI